MEKTKTKNNHQSGRNLNKTFFPKKGDIKREWHLVDANGQILGRLATGIAKKLMGKHKPQFSYHLDCGDNVVVFNAEKIMVTGRKTKQKMYQHYTGYPGNLKELSYGQLMKKNPRKIIFYAVEGMLPKNKLRDERLRRLKIFVGVNHSYVDKFKKEVKENA